MLNCLILTRALPKTVKAVTQSIPLILNPEKGKWRTLESAFALYAWCLSNNKVKAKSLFTIKRIVKGFLKKNIFLSVWRCQKWSDNIRKCLKVFENVPKCPKVSKSIKKCPKVSKSVQNYQKVSKRFRTFLHFCIYAYILTKDFISRHVEMIFFLHFHRTS